ncbi:MAG: hypothetical protein GY811_22850 [Myxococcales bacterium]|nr:hypothetical protein [Myxococcales bacterium]
MRKSQFLIAASLIALVALGVWLWPNSSKKTDTKEGAGAGESTSLTLEQRKAARRGGTVSTAPASIAGVVVEIGSERPIAGALISLSPRKIDGGMISRAGQSPAPVIARTDAKGRFHIASLSAGSYSLSASANGYRPMAQDAVVLEAGRDRDDLRFSLATGGHQLRGLVSDIGGGPVALAQVRATLVSGFTIGTLFRAPFTASTDEEGAYQLNLEDGRYQVSVFHEDYRRAEKLVVIGGSDRNAEFVLTPGSMIEGVVLRSSDDSPVAGALVTVMPAGQSGGFVMSGIAFRGGAQTDVEGRFTLGGLGSGAFEVQAVAKHASSRQKTQVELGIAESASDVVVYVDDAYTLSGFVVDSDDESVAEPGVLVGAYNFSPGAVFASSQPSAIDGYFEIHGVHPGTYTLGAAAEERQPTFFGETITVVDEDMGDLVVKVKSGATLRGVVSPAQETQVHLRVDSESMGMSTMLQAAGSFMVNGSSNADGEFELKGVGPGEYTLVAEAESGEKGTLDISVSGDMEGLEVTMQERASAHGIVVDSGGHPVEGVIISFKSDTADPMSRMNMMRPGPTTISGPDGRFVHVGLEDGGYEVIVLDSTQLAWAGKEGEAAYRPEHIDVVSGGDVHGMRLAVISRNESIRGSVVNAAGALVADAWVTAKYIPDANSSASVRWSRGEDPVLTDESGRFEIPGLRKGSYDLRAEGMRGGAKGKLEKVSTGSDVSILLEALGAIGGKVSRGGNPVTDFVITATGNTKRRAHIVANNGEFHLRHLEPGDYTVEVSCSEGAATLQAKVESGKEFEASVSLAAFGSISGVLLDQKTGEPLAGISVAATIGESGSRWAENAMDLMQGKGPTTDEEGRFHVGKLGAGQGNVYFVDPNAKGFGMLANQGFELAAGESKDLGDIRGGLPDFADPIDEEKRGTLGMETEVGTAPSVCSEAETAEGLGEDEQHLWVVSIAEDGPADNAGVERCDRIISVPSVTENDVPPMGLQMFIKSPEVGKTVTLGLITSSGETTVTIDPTPAVQDEATP